MTLNNDNNNECCKCTTPQYEITLNQQGPQGRQGNPGKDGKSPEITVASNTLTNYQLSITTADGSFTTPNLKATIPTGGNTGDVLMKNSGTDGDYSWNTLTPAGVGDYGVIQLATIDDMEEDPEDPGSGIDDSKAVTPNLMATYVEQEIDNITYTLPVATTTILGGIKVGNNLIITEDGILSATAQEVNQATATTLGTVKANAKQDTDTQEVRIDTATGLLYTKPASAPDVIDGGNASND